MILSFGECAKGHRFTSCRVFLLMLVWCIGHSQKADTVTSILVPFVCVSVNDGSEAVFSFHSMFKWLVCKFITGTLLKSIIFCMKTL